MPIYFQISSQDLPLSIESIGNHWAQEDIGRSNGYPYYHWLQTERGSGKIHIGGQTILLGENMGILIHPFLPHSYQGQKDWTTKFVTFRGRLHPHIDDIVGGSDYILASDTAFFSFSAWIDRVIAEYTGGSVNQNRLSVSCYEFLLHFRSQGHVLSPGDSPALAAYVLPTIQEIESRYSQPINLQSLADRLFVSPQYLSRVFKKSTGQTIFTYLQSFRIAKSKELLLNRPSLKIQDVAYQCGFSDASYFISCFRKSTSYTPFQFRKLYITT